MKAKKKKWRRRLEIISLFVIPYSIALISGKENPYGTSIAVGLLWVALPIMFIWLTFDREASSVLLPSSILRNKIKESTLAKADTVFRVLIIAGSLAGLFFFTVPVCIDVYELFQSDNAIFGDFKIVHNHRPMMGTWFLLQIIELERREKESFYFLFANNTGCTCW